MKFLMVLFTLLSISAFAGDRNSAYETVCKNLTFESDRNKCAEQIRNYSYFDDSALQICTIFTFQSDRMNCVLAIADKAYEIYEIDRCRNTSFDSAKLQCLKDTGRIFNQTCLPRQEVLNQLRNAQIELRSGSTGTVDKRLTYLIGKFSLNCQ